MQLDVRTARKQHRCRGCSAAILRGDPYTQRSLAPGEKPNREPVWAVDRFCTSCMPIAVADLPVVARCSYQVGDDQCQGPAGHHPATDHEFQLGLF